MFFSVISHDGAHRVSFAVSVTCVLASQLCAVSHAMREHNCSSAVCRQGVEYCDEVVGRCSRCVEAVCHLNPRPRECNVFCFVVTEKPDTSNTCRSGWENALSEVQRGTFQMKALLCVLTVITLTVVLVLMMLVKIVYQKRQMRTKRMATESRGTPQIITGLSQRSPNQSYSKPPPYSSSTAESPLRSSQNHDARQARPMAALLYSTPDEELGEETTLRSCTCPQPLDQNRFS